MEGRVRVRALIPTRQYGNVEIEAEVTGPIEEAGKASVLAHKLYLKFHSEMEKSVKQLTEIAEYK